jgi:hypothetical protein
MGDRFTSISYSGSGWNPQIDSDCVFTGSGACEQQWGFDITGAYKHYWLPILSSAVYGSYLELHYPAGALAGFGGAVGVSNLKETRVGTNLVWTPLEGFDRPPSSSMRSSIRRGRLVSPRMRCSPQPACRPSSQPPANTRPVCESSAR